MDIRLMACMQQVLDRMTVPISVLDREGNSLIPASDIRFVLPASLNEKDTCYHEGRFFHVCGTQPQLVLMTTCPDTPASRDCLVLCDAMIGAMMAANTVSNDIHHVWQRMLQNELSAAEMDVLAEEKGLTVQLPRCVLLMHMVQVQNRSAYDIMADILPMAGGDVLVNMEKHTAVYVKDVSGLEEEEELHQFACALQETLMSETGLGVTIGISEMTEDLNHLHRAYRQARRAIEIGRVYTPEHTVHMYRTMYLQRFLSDLNPDVARHYYSLLFNPATNRLFTDEMLYTIEMFFKKDLNLSETARQLYIHRNTLVYRLDKVQRTLGLDLRKFDDAVTFKILHEMRKCGSNLAAEH